MAQKALVGLSPCPPEEVPTVSTDRLSEYLLQFSQTRNLMLEQLRRSGVKIEKVEEAAYGRFAWIEDPEGNHIELWEPKGK